MAPSQRTATAPLTYLSVLEELYSNAEGFDFNQAIRILESATPRATPLGQGSSPQEEAVEIRSHVGLSVPSCELKSLMKKDSSLPVLTIHFLGLAGIQGPLPTPYTELMLQRLREKDTALTAFLDIFNHRLVSLWHRLHQKTFLSLPHKEFEKTPLGQCFFNLIGLASHHLQKALPVPSSLLLRFTALFWQRPRSLEGLQRLLSAYLNLPLKIRPYQGSWAVASSKECTFIGKIHGKFHSLGQGALLGRRVWEQERGIEISFSNLSWELFCSLHPFSGKLYTHLKDLIYLYGGLEHHIVFRLSASPEAAPLHLPLNGTVRLGWTSWLPFSSLSSQAHSSSVPTVQWRSDPREKMLYSSGST